MHPITRHCLGARDVVRNVGVGMCLSCRHLLGEGASMDAPAYRGPDRVWHCDQYLETGPAPAPNAKDHLSQIERPEQLTWE